MSAPGRPALKGNSSDKKKTQRGKEKESKAIVGKMALPQTARNLSTIEKMSGVLSKFEEEIEAGKMCMQGSR